MKRGEKPFSDGMLGHVKLLSDRTTLDERIRESFFFVFFASLNILSFHI